MYNKPSTAPQEILAGEGGPSPSPMAAVMGLYAAGQQARAFHVVAELKLADAIGDGAKTLQEIVAITRTHPDFTFRRTATSSQATRLS